MSRIITSFIRTTVALGIGLLLCGRVHAQICLGDCNGDNKVTAGELTRTIAIILSCDGVPTGCAAVPGGGCLAADKDGNNIIRAGELTNIISNILNLPMGCPEGPPPTATNTPLPTNTPQATSTRTLTRTTTRTRTPTPTPSPRLGAAACGDSVVQGGPEGEECDDGGVCTGGDNAGTPCTSDAQCTGEGICDEGSQVGKACSTNADCPSGKCVRCRTFGGDGCANNCTLERDVPTTLVPGVTQRLCKDGANAGQVCTNNSQCAGSICQAPDIKPGTSGAFVHDGIIQLALPLSGTQTLTIGKLRNGKIPMVAKADSLKLPQIKVGSLACACVRGVAAKSCGGTLFEADGTFTTSCTPVFTAGDSECAGKKPCAFVNGPGNSASGIIGCNGLDGFNLSFTQDGGQKPGDIPPIAPTPHPNQKPPVIVLSGMGPPGSAILLNTSAIGTTVNGPTSNKCAATHPDFGPDGQFCTDDDPQSTRGTPNTLPQVTGTATGQIFNTTNTLQVPPEDPHSIGPRSYTGMPYNCSALSGSTPSTSGAATVGAFTGMNQPATGDIVVRSIFISQ